MDEAQRPRSKTVSRDGEERRLGGLLQRVEEHLLLSRKPGKRKKHDGLADGSSRPDRARRTTLGNMPIIRYISPLAPSFLEVLYMVVCSLFLTGRWVKERDIPPDKTNPSPQVGHDE